MLDRTRCRIVSQIPGRRVGTRFMKRRSEKHFEHVMRFFTPELYVRFNSPDEEEADRANEEWETALVGYRKHLDQIWGQIPDDGKQLADLCLHDAELLGPKQAVEPLFRPAIVILPLIQEDHLVTLIYMLSEPVREHPAAQDWPFSRLRTHWLYDEIDVDGEQRGMFVHRVLLSDGRVLEIPFVSAMIRSVALSPPTGGEAKRTSA